MDVILTISTVDFEQFLTVAIFTKISSKDVEQCPTYASVSFACGTSFKLFLENMQNLRKLKLKECERLLWFFFFKTVIR